MNKIAVMGMSLFIMGCSLTVKYDDSYNEAWINNARGSYDLGRGAYDYFMVLYPSVRINKFQSYIRIESDGSFVIEDFSGDPIRFTLTDREGDREGIWTVYRFTYIAQNGARTTKYASVALGETLENIIIGSAYMSESYPQEIFRGDVILQERY